MKESDVYPSCPRQTVPQGKKKIVDVDVSLYRMIKSQYYYFAAHNEPVGLPNGCQCNTNKELNIK